MPLATETKTTDLLRQRRHQPTSQFQQTLDQSLLCQEPRPMPRSPAVRRYPLRYFHRRIEGFSSTMYCICATSFTNIIYFQDCVIKVASDFALRVDICSFLHIFLNTPQLGRNSRLRGPVSFWAPVQKFYSSDCSWCGGHCMALPRHSGKPTSLLTLRLAGRKLFVLTISRLELERVCRYPL